MAFISSVREGGGGQLSHHTGLRKGWVHPQRMGLEELDDHWRAPPYPLSGPGLCSALRVIPLGWQLLHEWRHVEVSAGVQEQEGEAGALSEGAEGQGGDPTPKACPGQ